MAANLIASTVKSKDVTVRPRGPLSIVTVDSKESTVMLRQKLARQGIHCSFPWPTWNGDRFEFHAERPDWMSNEYFTQLVNRMYEEE